MRFHLPLVACEFNEEFSLTTHFTTDKFFLSIGHQSQIFRVFFFQAKWLETYLGLYTTSDTKFFVFFF